MEDIVEIFKEIKKSFYKLTDKHTKTKSTKNKEEDD